MLVRKAKIQVLLASMVALCTCVFGQDSLAPWLMRLDSRMLNQAYYRGFSGVVLVAEGDSVVFEKAYGLANDKEGEMMAAQHKFMVASLSKSFTAAAVMMLVEEGKLDLDDKVGHYIEELQGPLKDDITVRQLLNHTSGIPDYINDFPLLFRMKSLLGWKPKQDQLLRFITRRGLEFKPGDEFNYSNSGYFLLAELVERLSGRKFSDFVTERIFTPFNIQQSGFDWMDEVDGAAIAYGGKFYRRKEIKNLHPNLIFGMGGMYATAGDLYKWIHAITQEDLVSDSIRQLIFDPGFFRYGYGWDVNYQFGEKVYAHGGYLPGWNSQVMHLSESKLTCVVVSNYDDVDPMKITDLVARLWYNHSEQQALVQAEESRPQPWEGRYARDAEAALSALGSNSDMILQIQQEGAHLKLIRPVGPPYRLDSLSAEKWENADLGIRMTLSTKEDGQFYLKLVESGKESVWRKL